MLSSTDIIFIHGLFCSKWIFSQVFQDISWFCRTWKINLLFSRFSRMHGNPEHNFIILTKWVSILFSFSACKIWNTWARIHQTIGWNILQTYVTLRFEDGCGSLHCTINSTTGMFTSIWLYYGHVHTILTEISIVLYYHGAIPTITSTCPMYGFTSNTLSMSYISSSDNTSDPWESQTI